MHTLWTSSRSSQSLGSLPHPPPLMFPSALHPTGFFIGLQGCSVKTPALGFLHHSLYPILIHCSLVPFVGLPIQLCHPALGHGRSSDWHRLGSESGSQEYLHPCLGAADGLCGPNGPSLPLETECSLALSHPLLQLPFSFLLRVFVLFPQPRCTCTAGVCLTPVS